MTKPCPECSAPVDVQPINVLGRELVFSVLCEACSEKERAAEALARRDVDDPEERIRSQLHRLGVNVQAHGRYSLAHVLERMDPCVQRAAREFLADVRAAGRWDPVRGLILEGPTGVGKSWLAVALIRELVETGALKPAEVRYDRSRFVWGLIRTGYGDGTATAEMAARMQARLWVLDDFGAEHATDDTAANLTDILSARELRPMIVTANLPRDAHESRFGAGTWDRVRSRLGDRNFHVVPVLGSDHRGGDAA